MSTLALFLLLASRVVSIHQTFEVEDWVYADVRIERAGAFVHGEYRVTQGGDARLLLIRKSDLGAYRSRGAYQSLTRTLFDSAGRFHQVIPNPGEYALVIENEDRRRPAKLEVKVEVEPERTAREVPAARRAVIVVASLGFLAAAAVYSARKLRA